MVRTARIFAISFAVLVGLSGGRGSARASSPDLDLVYSTFLGGSGQEWALSGITVDSAGRAWIAGSTDSIDYPVLDPETFRIERVLRTGGSAYEGGTKVAPDPEGTAVHLAGVTASADFPLVAAVQTELKGIADVYVMKIALNRPPDCSAAFAAPAVLWPPPSARTSRCRRRARLTPPASAPPGPCSAPAGPAAATAARSSHRLSDV